MSIKWIVKTTSSYSDLNGNTYHFAQIMRTSTRKSLAVENVHGENNAVHLLMDRRNKDGSKPIASDYREIYTVQVWEKPREWQRLLKFASGYDGTNPTDAVPEYKVTPAMLRALSSSAVPEYVG